MPLKARRSRGAHAVAGNGQRPHPSRQVVSPFFQADLRIFRPLEAGMVERTAEEAGGCGL